MIVFDLEWNSGPNPSERYGDILQIGAVRISEPGAPITDTFHVYVRPSVHTQFSPVAERILDIAPSLRSELDFPAALAAFREWCGGEYEFATWGVDDAIVLYMNIRHWKEKKPKVGMIYDFQYAFSKCFERDVDIALWKAVQYVGIPDSFHYHDALHDALYTALVGGWMGTDAKQIRPPKKKQPPQKPRRSKWCRGLCETPFPDQEIREAGTFSGIKAALNSRDSRRPCCPFCGERFWVQQWWPETQERYYSRFVCPEHGKFLCCLTLTPMGNGAWRGELTVPAMTEALLNTWEEITKKEVLPCRRSNKPGKKRRKRRKEKKKAKSSFPIAAEIADGSM